MEGRNMADGKDGVVNVKTVSRERNGRGSKINAEIVEGNLAWIKVDH